MLIKIIIAITWTIVTSIVFGIFGGIIFQIAHPMKSDTSESVDLLLDRSADLAHYGFIGVVIGFIFGIVFTFFHIRHIDQKKEKAKLEQKEKLTKLRKKIQSQKGKP